ncbi:MAG: TonB-dependent receptor [Oceanicaulis sp.]
MKTHLLPRLHLVLGLSWFLAGMILGEHMGRTGDHGQHATHAHIMLVGGVLAILWAVIHRLFVERAVALGWVQFGAHHLGAAVMIPALFALYGGLGDPAVLGPLLGLSGLVLMASVALMILLVLLPAKKTVPAAPAAA